MLAPPYMDHATRAGLIVAVIVDRPTCLLCVALKSSLTPFDTVRTIERIQESLAVTAKRGDRCRVCGSTVGPVYSLARPQ